MSKFNKNILGINVYNINTPALCYRRDKVKVQKSSEVEKLVFSKESFFSNLNKYSDKYNTNTFYIQFYRDLNVDTLDFYKLNKLFMTRGFCFDWDEETLYLFTLRRLNIGESVLNCV